MGYNLKRVQKSEPMKKIKEVDEIYYAFDDTIRSNDKN